MKPSLSSPIRNWCLNCYWQLNGEVQRSIIPIFELSVLTVCGDAFAPCTVSITMSYGSGQSFNSVGIAQAGVNFSDLDISTHLLFSLLMQKLCLRTLFLTKFVSCRHIATISLNQSAPDHWIWEINRKGKMTNFIAPGVLLLVALWGHCLETLLDAEQIIPKQ